MAEEPVEEDPNTHTHSHNWVGGWRYHTHSHLPNQPDDYMRAHDHPNGRHGHHHGHDIYEEKE